MGDVKVPEEEKKRLLGAIERAVQREAKARADRNEAITAAMDAGVSRQEIADAAQLSRYQLYAILRSYETQS